MARSHGLNLVLFDPCLKLHGVPARFITPPACIDLDACQLHGTCQLQHHADRKANAFLPLPLLIHTPHT